MAHFIATIVSYQVFITWTYITELNCFYTTSFSILKNKKQTTYEIFEDVKKRILVNTIVLKLHQKYFIAILKKLYQML